jgi:hypothetical protein
MAKHVTYMPRAGEDDAAIDVTPSGLRNGGLITTVELVDYEWRPLPAVALTDRNAMNVYNTTEGTEIAIAYLDDVDYADGVPIDPRESAYRDIKDTVVMYGMSSEGTVMIKVEELS